MLIENIKNYKSLNPFILYLKENNIDINHFFTKLNIKYQFVIINHWLTFNNNIGILITIDSYIIYDYSAHPFDDTLIELIYKIPFVEISDSVYEQSIIVAMKYLDKQLDINKNITPY